MKQLYLSLLVFLCLSPTLLAQEDAASAAPITETYYLEQLLNNPACSALSLSLGASGSGLATCAGVDNNDVWISTSATTQGSKYSIETTNFDAVVYMYDDAMNLLACENSNGANMGEELWVTGLTVGANYFIRIHSVDGSAGDFSICGWYLPPSEIRAGWSPYPARERAQKP